MRVEDRIAPGRGWRRPLRAAAAGTGLFLVAYAVALAVLSRPAVEARLRERIAETLQVHLGADVVLEGKLRVDPLLRVSFGPLVVGGATRSAPPLLRVEQVRTRAWIGALLAGRVEPASVELSNARVVIDPAAPRLAALGGERQRAALAGMDRPGGRDNSSCGSAMSRW